MTSANAEPSILIIATADKQRGSASSTPHRLRLGGVERRQADALVLFLVEILRRKPAFEGKLAAGPFAVEHGEPGGVAVAALDDHVLAKDAFEGESEPPRGAHRRGVERVAFPFVAPVAELVEDVAGHQVLGFRRDAPA